MDRYIEPNTTSRNQNLARIAIAAVIVLAFTSLREGFSEASEGISLNDADSNATHMIAYPEEMPLDLNANCSGYAAAYAAALVDLQTAQQIADDAYKAWYDCEFGIEGDLRSTQHEIPSAEYSVLVD